MRRIFDYLEQTSHPVHDGRDGAIVDENDHDALNTLAIYNRRQFLSVPGK
jgi:hypothetical protein